MASAVRRLIGVEIDGAAVEDAKQNAERNGVRNASFIASRAEVAIPTLLSGLSPEEAAALVAIVDPPRAGLHPDVCRALRGCLPLRRLIFVSCHLPGFVQNALALCRASTPAFPGPPFVPVAAYPLDLFPDTPHCEVVIVLERADAAAAGGEGGSHYGEGGSNYPRGASSDASAGTALAAAAAPAHEEEEDEDEAQRAKRRKLGQ